MEIPEAVIDRVAANQGTGSLANRAVAPNVGATRTRAIPLAPRPVIFGWTCDYRSDEPDGGPVAQVAEALRRCFGAR